MSSIIHGNQAPIPSDVPGAYGRNSAIATFYRSLYTPQQVAAASIRLTPAQDQFAYMKSTGELNTQATDDVFGYVEEDAKPVSGRTDGVVTAHDIYQAAVPTVVVGLDEKIQEANGDPARQELIASQKQEALQAVRHYATNQLLSKDANNNGRIDPEEAAAYLLLQDHSVKMIDDWLDNSGVNQLLQEQYGKSGADVKSELKALVPNATSHMDGQLTPKEREYADALLQRYPLIVNAKIGSIIDALSLNTAYADFKQRSIGTNA